MIVLYSTFLQFPGGGPAANYPVPVFSMGSNQLTLTFTDQSATTPLNNPVVTDEFGEVTFWAAPGNYVALLAGEYFSIPVHESIDDPVWPDLWIHEQVTPSMQWIIDHHFGVTPGTEIVIMGEETESSVSHPSNEQTVISFGAATTGFAYLRR